MLLIGLSGAALPGSLEADLSGFRSQRGQVMACLTTQPEHFPDCQDDPRARKLTVPTRSAATLRFNDLPSGTYALALIHDENGNGKLDTMLGIPREGFGFSRNPVIRFGAPSFRSAEVAVSTAAVDQPVKIKYLF